MSSLWTFLDTYYKLKQKEIDDIANIEELPKYFKDLWVKRFKVEINKQKVPHKFELRKKIHRKTIKKIMIQYK